MTDTEVSIEVWKEVKEWNGKYLISNRGRFKSIGGKYKKRYPDGYITLGAIGYGGYRSVMLRKPGFLFQVRVHTLVAEHFCVKPVSSIKLFVNHLDGNKLNNNYWNLEWCTPAENVRHAVATGLHDLKGEKHPHAKLTIEKVIEMRILRNKLNWTYQRIANQYGVERRQASDVIRGVNWGWLKEGLNES